MKVRSHTMTRRIPTPWYEDTQEAPGGSYVLRAVWRALRGDRQGARNIVADVRRDIRSSLQDGLTASQPADAVAAATTRGARLTPPAPVPSIAPPTKVTVRLPDGRTMHVAQVPAAARHNDLLNVARVNAANSKRAFAAIAHNGRAIDQLASSQYLLAERVTKLQSDGDLGLLRGIVEGLSALESRLGRVERDQKRSLAAQGRSTHKQIAAVNRTLKAQSRAMSAQKLHGAVATVQSVALATGGDLLTRENILMAANQLGWSFAGDLLLSTLGATSGAANLVSLAAPLANLATSRAILPPEDKV
jgi:hypothetical protein